MIAADPSKCTGCRYCELWCSFTHEGVFSPSLSRIIVVRDDRIGLDIPITCRMCSPAPCVNACPTGALVKGEDGTISIMEEKCIGCGSCAKACPYGAMRIHPLKAVPLICDLCGGGKPACISKCPTNALKLQPTGQVNLTWIEEIFDQAYSYALQQHKKVMERWGIHAK